VAGVGPAPARADRRLLGAPGRGRASGQPRARDSVELTVGLRDPIDHAVELYVRSSSPGAEPRRSASARIPVRASTGVEAEVERAGRMVLATYVLDPADGLGSARIFVARP
jgi:hypothetical protein